MGGSGSAKAFPEITSVALVIKEPLFREGLAGRLAKSTSFELQVFSHRPSEVVRQVRRQKPDLLVVDMALGLDSALRLMSRIKNTLPILKQFALVDRPHGIIVQRVLEHGADAWIRRDCTWQSFQAALQALIQGEIPQVWTRPPSIETEAEEWMALENQLHSLSNRELQVFELMGQGFETKLIAEHLYLSTKTVQCHQGRIKRKLGRTDLTQTRRIATLWHEQNKGI